MRVFLKYFIRAIFFSPSGLWEKLKNNKELIYSFILNFFIELQDQATIFYQYFRKDQFYYFY